MNLVVYILMCFHWAKLRVITTPIGPYKQIEKNWVPEHDLEYLHQLLNIKTNSALKLWNKNKKNI